VSPVASVLTRLPRWHRGRFAHNGTRFPRHTKDWTRPSSPIPHVPVRLRTVRDDRPPQARIQCLVVAWSPERHWTRQSALTRGHSRSIARWSGCCQTPQRRTRRSESSRSKVIHRTGAPKLRHWGSPRSDVWRCLAPKVELRADQINAREASFSRPPVSSKERQLAGPSGGSLGIVVRGGWPLRMRATPTTASISQTTPSINQTSMISSLLMELCCPADAQVLRRAVVSTCGKLLANDVTSSHTTTMLRSARQQQRTLGGRYTEACPPRGTLGGRRASALLPFCQLHLPKQPSGRVDVPGPCVDPDNPQGQ